MPQIPAKKSGLPRLWAAAKNSLEGLGSVWAKEEAFRLEMLLFTPATIAAWVLPLSLNLQIWLSFGALLVVLMEMINTGLERVVDLVTEEWHQLAKEAKDIGSALIFVSTGFYLFLWALAAYYLL